MSVSFSDTTCSKQYLGGKVSLTPSRREGIRSGVETIQAKTGLTIEALSIQMGISQQHLDKILNGIPQGNKIVFPGFVYQSTLKKMTSFFEKHFSSDEFNELCMLFFVTNVPGNVEQAIASGAPCSKNYLRGKVPLTPSRREGIRSGVETIRSEIGLTLKDLSIQMGISQQQLSRILKGTPQGNEIVFPGFIRQSKLKKMTSFFEKHFSSDKFSKFCALFSATNVSENNENALLASVLAQENIDNENALLTDVLEEDENFPTTNENQAAVVPGRILTNVFPVLPLVSNVLAPCNTLLGKENNDENALLASVLEPENNDENALLASVLEPENNDENALYGTIENIKRTAENDYFLMFERAINGCREMKKRRII
jgi:transcriptional regulator with XRE-family HTH domain